MQLFLERGYEGGVCEGLGFIEGEVVKFEEDLNLKSHTWVGMNLKF